MVLCIKDPKSSLSENINELTSHNKFIINILN
jgi:hypothetical protein